MISAEDRTWDFVRKELLALDFYPGNFLKIILTGWIFNRPVRPINERMSQSKNPHSKH